MRRHLQRLANADPLSDIHIAHLQTCRRCDTAATRLARITDHAVSYAFAPSRHIACALASVVTGFSAH
jgi:hypothetical protein